MKKFFQKTIKENVLTTNVDHKKDLTYFYKLRVKNFRQKQKTENSNCGIDQTKLQSTILEKNLLRLLPEKMQRVIGSQKLNLTKILTNLKNRNYKSMKNPLTKFNRKLRRGIFTLTPKFVAFVMMVSVLSSFSFGANVAYAAETTAPTVSAPTSTAQTLKGGDTSTSTIQMNEAGNIYLQKNGTGTLTTRSYATNLTGLVITGGTVSGYTFSGSTYLYGSVTTTASSVTITPMYSAGSVTVNGSSVSSGVPSSSIPLSGTTSITVVVSETAKTNRTYTLKVAQAFAPTATGTYTTDSLTVPGYYITRFTGNGTYTPPGSTTADILVIGAGGAGGRSQGKGGDAGDYVYSTGVTLTGSQKTVNVGSGGKWVDYLTKVNGGSSSITNTGSGGTTTISASGGVVENSGYITSTGGLNGNNVGDGYAADANGESVPNTGNPGGAGIPNSITGTTKLYAAGGRGCGTAGNAACGTTAYTGGAYTMAGGGYYTGNNNPNISTTAGAGENTGSGASAQSNSEAYAPNGLQGADGVVIIKVPAASITPTQAIPTFTTSGSGASLTTEITSSGADAIYYTTDGTDPTISSTLYTGSFSTGARTIKALAVKSGYSNSPIGIITYINDWTTEIAAGTAFLARSSASANTPYTVTLPTSPVLSDGVYNIVGVDTAGNTSTAVSGWLTVDNTAPVISEYTPVSTPTTSSTPNYVFTTNEAGTISYGGSCSSATTSAIVGLNTITFNSLADGTYSNCTITVTDSVGNISSSIQVSSFKIDRVRPTVSSVVYTSSTIKNGTSQTITANFDEELLDSPVVKISISGATTLAATAMTKVSTTQYTYTSSSWTGDGVNTVSFSVGTDAAGNVVNSTPTAGYTFTVDNTAPVTFDDYSGNNTWKTYNQTITLNPSDTTSGVAVTKYCTSSISCDPSSGTTYTAPVLISAQGTSYFRYSSTDNAGNVQSANTLTIKIDTTLPVAATNISPTVETGNVFQYVTNYNLTWTAGTDNGANASGLATTPYTISRYDTALSCAAGTGGNKKVLGTSNTNSFSTSATPADQSALSPGDNWIGVMITDNAGNNNSSCSGAYINIDNNAPTVPGTPATSTTPLSDSTPTWTWTASTDSESNMASTGSYAVQWATDTGFTQNVGSGTSNTNSYTHTSTLANGTWYFKVKAIDRALNESAYSSYGSVLIDVSAPTLSMTAFCSIPGNGCTSAGQSASPQQIYSMRSVAGTAGDTGGSNVDIVQISIQDLGLGGLSNGNYYNGSDFSSGTEIWNTATGTTTWSYSTSSVPFEIGRTYKIRAKSIDGASNTSTISDISFVSTNAPPVVSNLSTPAQHSSDGTISLSYKATDIESDNLSISLFYDSGILVPSGGITSSSGSMTVSSGALFPNSGYILIDNEIISYTKSGNVLSLTRASGVNYLISGVTYTTNQTTSASHSQNTKIYIYAPSVSGDYGYEAKSLNDTPPADKNILWDARTDASGIENSSMTVRLLANDGSSGEMVHYAESSSFNFDQKSPSSTVTVEAGTAGVSDAVVTIPMPVDISTVEYRISDHTSNTPQTTGSWTSITGDTTASWGFDAGFEAKDLNYEFRDSYGNVTGPVLISTPAPVTSGSLTIQDVSNVATSYYAMYIGWADANEVGTYKLQRASSSDNITYGSYSVVDTSGGLSTDNNGNYHFLDVGLDTTKHYKYKLSVVSGSNISVSVQAHVKPNGVQDYGEGGGGSVATAPKVENVVPTQNTNTKVVSVSYLLTDSSAGTKNSPEYEAVVMYNIGVVTTGALSGGNLPVSDVSRFKSGGGYIQLNNEVLQYTGKNSNSLTGIVRATWPTSPKLTRQNSTIFTGTPVWVMATDSITSVSDSSITTSGYSGSITWNAQNDVVLAGGSYSNTGIRVLVHDNQPAESGPLSSQSDFSEDGTLDPLVLTAPTIGFGSTTSLGSESSTPATFTLSLSRVYPLTTTVDYVITGTATGSGTDYTLANGIATITAGETSVNIEAIINNDSIKEGDETIIVTISSPTNSSLGANTVHTYTITDDDNAPMIAFDATTSSGSESTTSVNIPVSVESISGTDITVAYAVTGGTATGSGTDYTLASGIATITAGQTTTNISISVVNDQSYESNETIIVTISNPNGATLGVNRSHTYTITEDDSAPVVAFSSATTSASESTTTVNIPVSINFASYQNVSVDYTVTGGTATGSGTDYTLASGTGTITAGQTSANIVVTVVDDLIDEENETIEITLSPSPVNATLGDTTVYTYTIVDNDSSTTVGFDTTSSSGAESVTSLSIPVSISAASGLDVTVSYAITGTATGSGTDYTLANGTATITAGETSTNISVTIADDSIDEVDETVIVTLSSPNNASLNSNTVYTYTITDNDNAPTIGFTTDNGSSLENATPAAKTIPVSISTASGKSVNIAYTITTDGTATLNSDFTAINTTGTLTIAPGSTTASIPFTVINDATFEQDETIIVTLASESNATLATSTYTYTITNDDVEADTTAPTFTFDEDQGITTVSTDVYSMDLVKGATFNFPTYIVSDNVTATESITVTKSTDTISTANVTTTPIVVTYTVQDSATPKNTKIVTLRVNVILAASYTVTVTAGANGTVDADDTTKALNGYSANGSVYTIPRATTTTGNNATFTITPDSGFSIDLLTVDGVTRASTSSLTFSNIISNITIDVSFAANLDTTAPEITLLGESDIDVILGDTYTDAGITATEDDDVACTEGDTTTTPQSGCRWSKSGTVNTAAVSGNTPYKIIYKAINSRGLVSTAERIVNVIYADTYDLTLTVTGSGVVKDENGDTILSGIVAVDSLSTPEYTFEPASQLHKVKALSVTVAGVTTPLNVDDYQSGYTFGLIKGDVSMSVTFGLMDEPTPQIQFDSSEVNLDLGATYPTTDWDAFIYATDGVTRTELVTNGVSVANGVTFTITGNSTASGVTGADVIYTVTYTGGADGTVVGTATRTLNVTDNVPPVISSISTPVIKSDVVMISWNTNEKSNTQIYWDTTSRGVNGEVTEQLLSDYAYSGALRDDTDKQTTHWALMDTLTATTKYYYVVVSVDGSDNMAISPEQEVDTVDAGQVIIVNSGGGGSSGVALSTYEALQRELEELKKNRIAGMTTLPTISNIKVSDVTAFGATISFDTDRLTVAGVDYGKTKDFGKTEGNFKWTMNHKINIGGLTVGTDYYYGIAVVDKYSNIGVSVGDKQVFKTKFFSENLDEINKIENVEQFQNEIESSIESILPSLVPPFVEAPVVTDITEDSATITYKTNIKGFSLVSYATDDFYDEKKENPYNGEVSDTTGKVLTHKVKLINLKSNTKYHFSAKAFSLPQIIGKSKDFTFTTKASKIKVSVTNITKNSFTVSWNTNGKTSSIVEYKNLKTGKVNKRTDDIRSTGHVVKIENLDPGTLYQVDVSGINEIGNTVESAGTITIKTSTDVTAPVISKVKVDSSLVVGRNDKTQTIVSWKTDEPSTSTVYYEEGSGSPDKPLANKQEDLELTLNHVVILTTLKPGTVYRFQVASSDDANNVKKLPIRTIITPRPSESIVDVIFKNFNESFNFINNVK